METIRVHSYVGDLDDADEVIVIGPYADAAERDAELARLQGIRGLNRGDFTFSDCDIPVGLRSVTSADAAKVAQLGPAATSEDLGEIIWGS